LQEQQEENSNADFGTYNTITAEEEKKNPTAKSSTHFVTPKAVHENKGSNIEVRHDSPVANNEDLFNKSNGSGGPDSAENETAILDEHVASNA